MTLNKRNFYAIKWNGSNLSNNNDNNKVKFLNEINKNKCEKLFILVCV